MPMPMMPIGNNNLIKQPPSPSPIGKPSKRAKLIKSEDSESFDEQEAEEFDDEPRRKYKGSVGGASTSQSS